MIVFFEIWLFSAGLSTPDCSEFYSTYIRIICIYALTDCWITGSSDSNEKKTKINSNKKNWLNASLIIIGSSRLFSYSPFYFLSAWNLFSMHFRSTLIRWRDGQSSSIYQSHNVPQLYVYIHMVYACVYIFEICTVGLFECWLRAKYRVTINTIPFDAYGWCVLCTL